MVGLCLLGAIFKLPERIGSYLLGYKQPYPAWKTVLKLEYFNWRDIKYIDMKHDVIDGYLYTIFIYENGSTVLVR